MGTEWGLTEEPQDLPWHRRVPRVVVGAGGSPVIPPAMTSTLLPAELSAHEVTAVVTGPSGQTVAAQVLEGDGGAYSIRFVPSETGVHSVSVKDRGQHVPGSPFQFTVGPMGEGGAHKVRAGGPGLERAEAGVPGERGAPQNLPETPPGASLLVRGCPDPVTVPEPP